MYCGVIQYIAGCIQQKLESKIAKALRGSTWQQESLILIQQLPKSLINWRHGTMIFRPLCQLPVFFFPLNYQTPIGFAFNNLNYDMQDNAVERPLGFAIKQRWILSPSLGNEAQRGSGLVSRCPASWWHS